MYQSPLVGLAFKNPRKSQAPETSGEIWNKEDLPLEEEDRAGEYWKKLNIHKSVGPDVMHLRALGSWLMLL